MGIDAPFVYFGGKSRVAAEVWRRFGAVRNYVEPFFGSGAVLLGRPSFFAGSETVNDADGLLANFWRAVAADPDAVAHHADWPVNEADLHARHLWLVERRESLTERLMGDPEWHDPKAAGWWVWGACAWIGSGWCAGTGSWCRGDDGKLAHVGNAGVGIHRSRPHLGKGGVGIHRKMPHVGDAGRGINRQMPHLGNAGVGINRQMPHLGDAGRGEVLREWFRALAARLERVRVCCGDWSRVLGDSVTWRHGATAVFLDPPYALEANRDMSCYVMDSGTVAHDVRAWAIEAGANPLMRIALCGYDEHDEMARHGWTAHRWKTKGGYGGGRGGQGAENQHREVCWFSPHCASALQPSFDDMLTEAK